MPMWASRKAGASFTPWPVIATTAFRTFHIRTIRILSSGVARARTSSISLACERMPSSLAMAWAVTGWSPVIITVGSRHRGPGNGLNGLGMVCSVLLSTGVLSPVRAASFVRNALAFTSLASAATTSPASSTKTSPGTMLLAAMMTL
jgi:hypothetical protein